MQVLVPGFTGTVLVSSLTGLVAYPTALPQDISLPLTWTGSPRHPSSLVQDRDSLVAGPPLYQVPGQKIYQSLKDLVETKWGTEFVGFGYDWRRDLSESVSPLAATVTALAKKTGCRVLLVSHSMGGLLAYGALNSVPGLADYVHSSLYAAVPFDSIPIYRVAPVDPALVGSFPAPMALTWPGGVAFLPLESPAANARRSYGYSLDGGETVAAVDYKDIATWRNLGLGPFSPVVGLEPTDAVYKHMRNLLARVRAWAKVMDPATGRRLGITHPPAAALASPLIPIPRNAAINDDRTLTLSTPEAADGTVMHDSVYPPGRACVRRHDATVLPYHSLMLENVADVEAIVQDLFAGTCLPPLPCALPVLSTGLYTRSLQTSMCSAWREQ